MTLPWPCPSTCGACVMPPQTRRGFSAADAVTRLGGRCRGLHVLGPAPRKCMQSWRWQECQSAVMEHVRQAQLPRCSAPSWHDMRSTNWPTEARVAQPYFLAILNIDKGKPCVQTQMLEEQGGKKKSWKASRVIFAVHGLFRLVTTMHEKYCRRRPGYCWHTRPHLQAFYARPLHHETLPLAHFNFKTTSFRTKVRSRDVRSAAMPYACFPSGKCAVM